MTNAIGKYGIFGVLNFVDETGGGGGSFLKGSKFGGPNFSGTRSTVRTPNIGGGPNSRDSRVPPHFQLTLTQGGFGEVYKAKHKPTGEMRAVKLIKKQYCDKEETEQLLNEVMTLKNLVSTLVKNLVVTVLRIIQG